MVRRSARGESEDPTAGKGDPSISLVVSYVVFTLGGGIFGFFAALCGIGGGARRGNALMASDATHGAIILALTLAGAALGFCAVWKTLGWKGVRRNRDKP
jgi:hypothetical protein